MTVDVETMIMELSMSARGAAENYIHHYSQEAGIPTLLSAWRADGDGLTEIVAVTIAPDRDEMLNIALKLRVGFDAAALVMSFDSYHATEQINPDTGQEWGPNEMGEYAQRHGVGPVVQEALNVMVARPDRIWTVLMPYRRTRRKIRWLRPDECGKSAEMVATPTPDDRDGTEGRDGQPVIGGSVGTVLRRIMATEALDLRNAPGGLPADVDPRVLCDYYAMNMIAEGHDAVVGSRYYGEPENAERLAKCVRAAKESFLLNQWKN